MHNIDCKSANYAIMSACSSLDLKRSLLMPALRQFPYTIVIMIHPTLAVDALSLLIIIGYLLARIL